MGSRLIPLLTINLLWAALAGCGLLLGPVAGPGPGGPSQSPGGQNQLSITNAVVTSSYSHTLNWNDYIRNTIPSLGPYGQAEVLCDGTEGGYYNSCLHAGELRMVVLPGVSFCTGLTAADTLGAFNWYCNLSGGQATFYSAGLKDTTGLADLINSAGNAFLSNSVVISQNGVSVGQTPSTVWWGNTVQVAPSSSGAYVTLPTPGVIYTIPFPGSTAWGYTLAADHTALVTLGGGILTFGTPAGNNCSGNKCLVNVNGQKFVWVEGRYFANGIGFGGSGVSFEGGTLFSRMHRVSVHSDNGSTIGLSNANSNYFDHNRSYGQGGAIVVFSLGIGSRNVVYDLFASSTNQDIIQVGAGQADNIFAKVLTLDETGGGGNGYSLNDLGSSGSTYSHYAHLNSQCGGFNFGTGTPTMNQAVTGFTNGTACGVGFSGVNVRTNGAQVKFSQLAVGNSNNNGIYISPAGINNSTFAGNLLVGSSPTTCNVISTTSLVNGTCTTTGGDGTNAYNTGAFSNSSALFHTTSVDFTNSFVEGVTSDTANTSNAAGVEAFALITDWFNFQNPFREWGPHGGFDCEPGFTCQIWDLRLKSSDTVLLNRSGNGSTANAPFLPGAACPAASSGNLFVTDQASTPHTFLMNALEIPGYGGNNNGLCESGETCVYSPNFGAYQGEGDPFSQAPCIFQDGTVTGVTLYAYPINGGS